MQLLQIVLFLRGVAKLHLISEWMNKPNLQHRKQWRIWCILPARPTFWLSIWASLIMEIILQLGTWVAVPLKVRLKCKLSRYYKKWSNNAKGKWNRHDTSLSLSLSLSHTHTHTKWLIPNNASECHSVIHIIHVSYDVHCMSYVGIYAHALYNNVPLTP